MQAQVLRMHVCSVCGCAFVARVPLEASSHPARVPLAPVFVGVDPELPSATPCCWQDSQRLSLMRPTMDAVFPTPSKVARVANSLALDQDINPLFKAFACIAYATCFASSCVV